MPFDPFAAHVALESLHQFLERLTADLRDRRRPLEGPLSDLLLVWDARYGRRELAVRLDAVGVAVRSAGLADEVTRMHDVRAAAPAGLTGTGVNVALALLDAAVGERPDRVADLLALLHDEYPHLLPDTRQAIGRAAEQLLAVWCDRHAQDYPARFRDEVRRLGLNLHLVEQWHLDHSPKLTPAAGLVLDRLLGGGPFAVGWLDEVDIQEVDIQEVDTHGTTDPVAASAANTAGRKRTIPKAEANALVGGYLLKHAKADPDAVTVRAIVTDTGVSAGAVANTPAWKAFNGERKKRRAGAVRTVPLTDNMLAVVPDAAAGRDAELARLIAEQAADDNDRRPARRERSRRS